MDNQWNWGLLLLLFFISVSCYGRELWVDRDSLGGSCSDDYSRQQVNMSSPWCTLGRAGSQATAGDIVRVRAGTYSEVQTCTSCNDNAVLQVVVSGTANARIRFEAFTDETVLITGDGGAVHGIQVIRTFDNIVPRYVDIQGFEIRDFSNNCISVRNTNDVNLTDLDISGCASHSVAFETVARVTLENSRIHDNPLSGWTSAVDLWKCLDGNIVRGNMIWANTDEHSAESEGHGIIMDFCLEQGGALIENNVIWDNEGWCIVILASDGGVLRNNTCWQNGKGRADTGEISILGRHHKIHNNILVPRNNRLALNIRERDNREPTYVDHLDTIASDSNILWAPNHDVLVAWSFGTTGTVAEYRDSNQMFGWGVNALQVDPRLVGPSNQDFRLQQNSPAIDSGDDSEAATIDIEGTSSTY